MAAVAILLTIWVLITIAALVVAGMALSRANSARNAAERALREIRFEIARVRDRFEALARSGAVERETGETAPAVKPPAEPATAAVPPLAEAPARPVAPPSPPAAPSPQPIRPAAPRIAPPRPEPPEAARPSLEQVIGGRWMTWVGAIAIVIAVGFLVRWAIQNNYIGPMARVTLGIASGLALIAGGFVARRRPALTILADGLTGAGLGILYLSLYASHAWYGFLEATAAFGSMALVTAGAVAISVATARQAIAVLAVLGGLITPILVSTERPDERVLLAYLIVLDLVVVGVARYRTWPALSRLAWLGSVLLFVPFLVRTPEPAHPTQRLALLSVLFVVFLAAPLVRPWLDRVAMSTFDLPLVVANGAAYFSAVYVTLEPSRENLEGPWALVLAAFYALAAREHARRVPGDAVGTITHTGAAAVLLTLAFPLMLDGPWVTLAWAVQAAVFIEIGRRLERGDPAFAAAIGLFVLSAIRLLAIDPRYYETTRPFLNVTFAVHLAVVAALAWAGYSVARGRAGPADDAPVPRDTSNADLRTALWVGASAMLAVLFWREPEGLWRAGFLAAETIALAALGRRLRDAAFTIATPLVAGALLLRLFVADAEAAYDAAAALVNAHLHVRVLGCVAIGVAAVLLQGAGGRAIVVARWLQGAAGFALLVALSLGWSMHHWQVARAAYEAGDAAAGRRADWALQVGLSVLWTIYAAVVLAIGFVRRVPPIRYAALALLAITIAKVFFVDLSELQAIYRVLSFLVLGVVLLAVAWAYQRGNTT